MFLKSRIFRVSGGDVPYLNEARRVFIRQWPKKDGIDHGKNRGVRADPEAQNEDGTHGEAGASQQSAESKAKIG